MFPQMRTSSTPNTQHPSPVKHVPSDAHFINNQHSTPIIQPHNQTSSLRCALHQHPTNIIQQTCSLICALYQQPTLNTHHPTPQPNKFPQIRTSSTPNTQHPSPNKHVPSDAHLINTQHSTPTTRQTCSLRCALHQHPTLNNHHPSNMFPQMRTSSTPNTQHPSPNKHVPSDAHSSTPKIQHPTPNIGTKYFAKQ